MTPKALLAIRSDIAPSIEAEYLEWLTTEHTIERVSIDGFLSARIFRTKHPDFGRYLILYELSDASVVDSPAYLNRLNNPTPWTTRMMPHLGNFIRGGGPLAPTCGVGYGAALAPIMIQAEISADDIRDLETISKAPEAVAVRILQTDSQRTTVATNERKLRSGDDSFKTLLMIEAFDVEAARRVTRQLPPLFTKPAKPNYAAQDIPVYSLIFHLND